MTTAQRRRARKVRLAEHIAAGTFVARRPRSHFLTVDIRDAVREDLLSMRDQMAAHRGVADPRIDVTPLEPGKSRRERAPHPSWAFQPEKRESRV